MNYINPEIESSYQENDIGKTLYDIVIKNRPKKIIDYGVLFGYSTVAMAMALDTLSKGSDVFGKIIVYDLWDKYEHKHPVKEQVIENLKKYNLEKYVELREGNFFEWIEKTEEFDLLHLDISNKGDIIEILYAGLKESIRRGSVVVFEGGTEERDNVAWMKKYNQKNIVGCDAPYTVVNPSFPGLSMLLP